MMARFIDLLVARWRVVLVLAVLLPTALTAAALVFEGADASVGLWAQGAPAVQATGGGSSEDPGHAQADAIMQVVQTSAYAEALRKELDRERVAGGAAERDQLTAAAVAHLQARASGSHLVVLTASCDQPPTCLQVITAAVAAYQQQAIKVQADQGSQLQSALGSQVNDAQNALQAAENSVATYLAAHPGETASSAPADPRLDLLLGQLTAAKQRAATVQSRLNDLQVSAATRAAQGTLTILDPAHLAPHGIIGDGGIQQAAVILLGCIALAVGYLLLVARLDDTAHEPQALEGRLGVPVLVDIPRFSAMRHF